MFDAITRFIFDNDGATAIEYGLIAALVSVAAVTALTDVGSALDVLFDSVASSVDGATSP